MPSAPQVLPLPTGQGPGSAAWWTTQLDWATEIRKDLLPKWRDNAKAYCDKLKPNDPIDGIRVNIDFEKTEQKRHQLFFRLPTLKLRALPRTIRDSSAPAPTQPGQSPILGPNGQPLPSRDLRKAIAIFREVLTRLVGPKGANSKAVMDAVIFDLLCPSGIAFVKGGYERFEGAQPIMVPTGAMMPDPKFNQPGAVLNISLPPPQIPEMAPAPNLLFEKYYLANISPANGLMPPEFRLSDHNEMDWAGHDFPMLTDAAKEKGWPIPTGMQSSAGDIDDERIMPLSQKGQRSGQIRCRELFYYANRIDASVRHPQKIRRLVFVHGIKDPVVHEDYKDQKFDPNGRFMAGLRTLPIFVITLRYVTDLAYPPSDCSITRRATDELSAFRTIQMKHRRKAAAMRWVDIHGIISDQQKEQAKRGEYYDTIATDGPGDRFMGEIAQARYPPDNNVSEDRIMADINRAWALGANSSGTAEKSGTTATEIASIAQATANRLGGEREAVTQFWCRLVEALGSLVQLYADHEDYVEILGEDGAKTVEAWTKDTVQGEFLYEAIPNSALAPDAAADRDLALNRYNLLANDPFANREQLYRDTVEAYDGDPDRLTMQPTPPPPEKPRMNVSFNGQDMNPATPQYPNVVALLGSTGVATLAPAAPPPVAQPPANVQTGPADVVDRERMRMAAADNADQRAGGLVGMGVGGR